MIAADPNLVTVYIHCINAILEEPLIISGSKTDWSRLAQTEPTPELGPSANAASTLSAALDWNYKRFGPGKTTQDTITSANERFLKLFEDLLQEPSINMPPTDTIL